MSAHIDPNFAQRLDPEVLSVLSDWAELHGRSYRLERWLDNGRSRQPVAYVAETDHGARSSRRLVMKVLDPPAGAVRDIEYGRHSAAVRDGGEFARMHLSTHAHDAVRCPDRRWITFQHVAGQDLESTEPLTVLLRRMLGIAQEGDDERITCDPKTFARACATVVAGVLGDWAGKPYLLDGPDDPGWTIPEFFRRHLSDRLEPGGRLQPWVSRYPGEQIVLPDESSPLPNPFAVAQGRYFADDLVLRPIVGKSHGDLHTDNALIKVRPAVDPSAYYLIDTAMYEPEGPLTRDPTHMLLYIIARAMPTTLDSPVVQSRLIDLLLDPTNGPQHLVPGWLWLVIDEVDKAASDWIRPSGFASLWEQQRWLSLAACALRFISRDSVREQDKAWFLRLAARAVARFADAYPGRRATPASRAAQPLAGSAKEWVGWICRELPDLSEAARALGREDEVDRFRADALSGIDRSAEYREFVRQLGGPDPGQGRLGTPGSEGQAELEEYVCPADRCTRRERRPPSGKIPECHLDPAGRRRLRSTLD